MRLLMRDAECVPGVALDIPGPFVIINPCAAENSGYFTQSLSGKDKLWYALQFVSHSQRRPRKRTASGFQSPFRAPRPTRPFPKLRFPGHNSI